MRKRIVRVYETQLKNTIHEWGRNVTIYYNSTANCSSCGYNPITKESTNSNCSTCNGAFFYYTNTAYPCKGVIKTFLGNQGFLDFSQRKINFYPEGDARLTCWLPDVLLDSSSPSGVSYFDKTDDVYIDGKHYGVKNTFRTGIEALKICVINLEEIKR